MDERPVMALRTPLYLLLAALGVLIVIATFLPWATVASEGADVSVAGTSAGGWGLAAIISGLAIAAVGVLGYFWNPFSDPEALFIAGFGIAVMNGASAQLANLANLVDPDAEFFPDASVGIGLWLILIAAIICTLGAIWIIFSRPRAEARLT